jgi:Transposase DDE domain
LGKTLSDAAVDTTGLEDRHTSHHFRKRREQTAKAAKTSGKSRVGKQKKSPFPKLGLLCDCLSHLTLSLRTGRGPGADHGYFKPLLDDAAALFTITRLLADAGFDAEAHHVYARHEHGTVAIIPAQIGRPTPKPPTGKHRRRMKARWKQYKKRYGQRWQVETVNSMLKRLLGSALRAVKYWSRCREMTLRLITLNIMILAASG